jgi:hypothetical protein
MWNLNGNVDVARNVEERRFSAALALTSVAAFRPGVAALKFSVIAEIDAMHAD